MGLSLQRKPKTKFSGIFLKMKQNVSKMGVSGSQSVLKYLLSEKMVSVYCPLPFPS